MRKILLLLVLPFALLFASIGKITIVSGDVTLSKSGKEQKAFSGVLLDEKDQVVTKTGSTAQLIFNDGTAISLGARSTFKVEEYLFDEAGSKGNVKFNVSEGAFRAITGKIGKISPDKFKLDTRTATIGIRGTRFLGIIPPNGAETIACTKGAISVTMIAPPIVPSTKPGQAPVQPAAKSMDVQAGQMTTVSAAGVEAPKAYTPADIKKLESAAGGDVKKADNSSPATTSTLVTTTVDDKGSNPPTTPAISVVDSVGTAVSGVKDTVGNLTDIIKQDTGATATNVVYGASWGTSYTYDGSGNYIGTDYNGAVYNMSLVGKALKFNTIGKSTGWSFTYTGVACVNNRDHCGDYSLSSLDWSASEDITLTHTTTPTATYTGILSAQTAGGMIYFYDSKQEVYLLLKSSESIANSISTYSNQYSLVGTPSNYDTVFASSSSMAGKIYGYLGDSYYKAHSFAYIPLSTSSIYATTGSPVSTYNTYTTGYSTPYTVARVLPTRISFVDTDLGHLSFGTSYKDANGNVAFKVREFDSSFNTVLGAVYPVSFIGYGFGSELQAVGGVGSATPSYPAGAGMMFRTADVVATTTKIGTDIRTGYTVAMHTDFTSSEGVATMSVNHTDGLVSATLTDGTRTYTVGSDTDVTQSAYIHPNLFAAASSDGKVYMYAFDAPGANEYVSWGYWAADNGTLSASVVPVSMWVAGVETPQAALASLKATAANYYYGGTGTLKGAMFNTSTGVAYSLSASSSIGMTVAYGSSSVSGNISAVSSAGTIAYSFAGSTADFASGNSFSATGGTDSTHGVVLAGKVYGPNADAVAGKFSTTNGTLSAAGLFKAGHTTAP